MKTVLWRVGEQMGLRVNEIPSGNGINQVEAFQGENDDCLAWRCTNTNTSREPDHTGLPQLLVKLVGVTKMPLAGLQR